MTPDLAYPIGPTRPVKHPIMLQSWKDLTYVHWRYDPDVVRRRLPVGLEVDTFDGAAWVGLVPFHMRNIRLPFTPPIPYLGTFPETNVRTYVRGPDGRPGVWFDSLDINRLAPVVVARTTYRLPYIWSEMDIDRDRGRVMYRARRRWPGPRGAISKLVVRRAAPIPIEEVEPRERFLTARWGLYTQLGQHLAFAPVDHPPWPLEHAELEHLDDEFVTSAGYPPPEGSPLVHYSPGVDVRIGLPRAILT